MKIGIIRKITLFSAVVLSFTIINLAQGANQASPVSTVQKSETKSDSGSTGSVRMKIKNMKTGSMNMKDKSSSIINSAAINLKAVDKNKDGKVFQCPMDFNVLSDKPGVDPNCGMKLKEVTLQQAKKNLVKHGFKVKD